MLGAVTPRHPKQGLTDLKNAGFTDLMLDFNIFGRLNSVIEEDYNGQLRENWAEDLRDKCREYDIKTPVAYAITFDKYSLQNVSPKEFYEVAKIGKNLERLNIPSVYDLALRVSKSCISTAIRFGAKMIVIQPYWFDISLEDEWKVNREYYLELSKACGDSEIQILLTNICKYVDGHLVRGICSDSNITRQWIDDLNQEVGCERFGFMLDSGYFNICGRDMYEVCIALGDRIKAVNLRDNSGRDDASLLPFTAADYGSNNTDWLGLIRGLREIAFDGELVVEFFDTMRALSPMIRPTFYPLVKAVGDYFKWQVEIENNLKKYKKIALFGAGNMCRNFMKNYGEKYRPLYTCDNNSKIWGTEFEGLTVNPPETLKELPEDAAIFICNVYYREIEAQLREMGIKNDIEYFNDEYMPTFYFDRFKRGD